MKLWSVLYGVPRIRIISAIVALAIVISGSCALVALNGAAPKKATTVSASYPVLREGSAGAAVKALQAHLNTWGAKPAVVVDGIFGPQTLAAIKAFQRARKLGAEGIVGPETWRALLTNAPRPEPSTTPAPNPASTPQYWTMAPSANSGQTAFPRDDTYCANHIAPQPERIPANYKANHTPGPADPSTIPWGPWTKDQGQLWTDYLSKVDGHFTGTTDEILEWAACKWGLDENWLKAEAVAESSWYQSEIGDDGVSYGILQVKDSGSTPLTNDAWGGYPWTQNSTAVDADFVAAYLRATFDGARGTSFYDGQTVGQIAAAHGWDYVMWGAVGSWYSGDWYADGAQDYFGTVQNNLASSAWKSY